MGIGGGRRGCVETEPEPRADPEATAEDPEATVEDPEAIAEAIGGGG